MGEPSIQSGDSMKRGDLVRRTHPAMKSLSAGIVVRVEDAETFNGHIYHVRWANSDTVFWHSREELENVNKCKDGKKSREMA